MASCRNFCKTAQNNLKKRGSGTRKGGKVNNEEKLNLIDKTILWLQILFLEDVEKDIMDKRCAVEIEHYYESVIFSAMKTKEIVDELKKVREEIAKNIREEKKTLGEQ